VWVKLGNGWLALISAFLAALISISAAGSKTPRSTRSKAVGRGNGPLVRPRFAVVIEGNRSQ
jgi:hypothetical protein